MATENQLSNAVETNQPETARNLPDERWRPSISFSYVARLRFALQHPNVEE